MPCQSLSLNLPFGSESRISADTVFQVEMSLTMSDQKKPVHNPGGDEVSKTVVIGNKVLYALLKDASFERIDQDAIAFLFQGLVNALVVSNATAKVLQSLL